MACRIGNEQTSEPGHDEKFCASAYWNTITISACIGSCAAKPWRSVCRLGQEPLKILVVDDQEFVRRSLHSLLAEQAHWQIYEAENGKVALERIREIEPDVVVLDIVMPEKGGLEVAYEISQHTPQTKVILISSHYTPEEAAILGRLFSDSAFIQKSEAGKELVPALTRLLPSKRATRSAKA